MVGQAEKKIISKGKVAACFIAAFICCGSVTFAQREPQPVKTVTEFAAALLAAKPDQEQDSLLAANKELVKQELFEAIYQAGLSFSDKRAWQQSLNGYQLAIKIATLVGSKASQGKALAGIGSDRFYQGKYDQSLDYFQKSLAIRREAGDKDGIGSALRQIAKIYRRLDNYARALEYLDQTRALVGEIKNKNVIADIEFEFGAVYFTRADYAAAVPRFQSALGIYREISFKPGIGAALDALAATYTDLGDFDRAIDFAQRALAEAGDNKGAVGRILVNLGVTYGQQGNYNRAIECFERALQLSKESGDQNIEAGALGNIGLVQYQQRNYAQALDYYQRALDLADKQGAKAQVSEILSSFGVLYAEQRDYEKAVDYYQRALLIGREIKNDLLIGETLGSLGEVFYHQGSFDKSISASQESLDLFQKLGFKQKIIGAKDNLALVYLAQNRNEAALQALTESLAIEKEIGASEYSWKTFNNLGLAYRSLKRNEDAEKAFLESANAVERLRTESGIGEQEQNFLQGRTEPYQNLVDLLIEQHRISEALSQAEQMKARLLLDVLHSGRVQITNAMTPVEKEQERALNYEAISFNSQIYNENAQDKPDQSRLASLKEHLQKARLNQQEFQTRLYAAHPDLKTQRAAVEPFALAQASALLTDQQTALLEYQFAKDRVFLFVVTRNAHAEAAVTVYTLKVASKELETLAGKYREQLATRNALFKETSAQLYDLLIKPAQAALRGKTKLVIVPDGVLWELPFLALTTEKKTYLIEDCAISFTPSLTVAVEMARKQRARQPLTVVGSTLLAFGNPSLGKDKVSTELFRTRAGSFSQLPEAENEVHQLGTLYGKERSSVFTGPAARESELKARAGAFRVIHLATHGILNDASPMYSQIVLSQEANGKDEDGLLEAWEIVSLNLNADLVVLSACETARGRVSEGEGMIGLSWALFVAGVPTTVVSQWKVDSASTSALMLEFHRQLLGNHSKAESLRQATLKLMRDKQYNHPFYWAAFVVVGDGN